MRSISIVVILAMAGCGSDGGSSGGTSTGSSPVDPLVFNAPDTFTVLPLGAVRNGFYSYPWLCSADQANLTVAGVTGGSVRIRILDVNSTTVHDNTFEGSLGGSLSAMTSPDGKSGLWTIEFTYDDITSVAVIDIQADLLGEPDHIELAGAYDLQSSFVYRVQWAAGGAKVTLASAISDGTVQVRMWDGNGNLVLSCTDLGTYVGLSEGESTHGTAGIWTVRIDVGAVATSGSITIHQP
ncbi:MAG TPA: hypothetical protein VFT32_06705 [Candidatus Eisenbacteria bacterium]|nr:hypothetical protein [Candidatus Eisenbacteria bacterium]